MARSMLHYWYILLVQSVELWAIDVVGFVDTSGENAKVQELYKAKVDTLQMFADNGREVLWAWANFEGKGRTHAIFGQRKAAWE